MSDVGGAQVGGSAAGYSGGGAPTVIDAYYSLLAEGSQFKNLPEDKRHFQMLDLDEALQILAEDQSGAIGPAARYHALEQLAQPVEEGFMPKPGGLPGYRSFEGLRDRRYHEYAATFAEDGKEADVVGHIHERQGDVEIDEIMPLLSKEARAVFDDTRVCTADLVTAHTSGGKAERTLRLFCEFVSYAEFDVLAGWLDPTTWPARGPLLFKSVQLVDPPGQVRVSASRGPGWHGTYLEVVELVGRPLRTYLDCAYQAMQGYAALTYDLRESVGGDLTVDRGFLSVTPDPSGGHRVRALKLVAFADGDEAIYEDLMCPIWTDCVQQAAESTATGGEPLKAPPPTTGGPVMLDPEALGQQWTECMTDASKAYADFAVDVAQELSRGSYDMDDYRRHGMWLWTNLARDWSRAWMGTMEVVEQVARLDRGDPSGRADPTAPPTATVIVGPVAERTDVLISELSGIGGNPRSIPVSALSVSPTPLEPGAMVAAGGPEGTQVTVTARITAVPPGLYIGELRAGARTEPLLLYVSDAVEAGGAAV
jgi:hypothetical protein